MTATRPNGWGAVTNVSTAPNGDDLVGVAAAAVTAKALGKQITHGYAIVAALIAIVPHAWLDAPLAQFLAGLGFSF